MDSMNRFAFNPASLDIPRSLFDRSCDRFQSLRGGVLQPIYVDEMLPGDSVTMKTNAFIRMSKPILPTMDPLYCDIFFFFVPMRLVWANYKQFFGENDPYAWTDTVLKELPHLTTASLTNMKSYGVYKSGSLLDCLGVHLGCDNVDSATLAGVVPLDSLTGLNTLPIRAYYSIAENWFRDENYSSPYAFSVGDSGANDWNITGVNSAIHQDGLCPVYALHDYFTSALPAPQKGVEVRPFGEGALGPNGGFSGLVPVKAGSANHILVGDEAYAEQFVSTTSNSAGTPSPSAALGVFGSNGLAVISGSGSSTASTLHTPSNLYANLPAEIFASVNQIRYAFALQRFFEKDARGGTRYREKIKAHFGVTGSDSSMMVPEYVGGQRFMLNMDTIITTADTSDGTTGEYAGYSKTFQKLPQWSFSTSEHGYLMGLCCIRPKMTYHQGIPKMFTRKDQLDFYWPSFANLGEQPILKKEIFAGVLFEDLPFGYNEPYAEYRFKPSELVGALRPESEDFIPGYTYARKLTDISANAGTVREVDPNIIKQNLAVPTGTEFVSMFHFEAKWRRPMPVYSIPGLVDHH